MRLSITDNVNRSNWDKRICSLAGTIFHSSVWAEYTIAGSPHAIPQFITLLSDEGDVMGAALGFLERSPHRLLEVLTRRLWFETMPAIFNGNEGILYDFLDLIEKHSRRSGYIELRIGSYASYSGHNELKRLGFDLTRRLEFVLPLDQTEEDLWKGLESKRRRNIKKAERMAIKTYDLSIERGIPELRRLQAESGQRISKRGGPEIKPRYLYEQDPVRILLGSGVGKIVCAEVDGRIVSASLFTCFNNLVYHTFLGHSQIAFETQAPTLLLWESIKRFRNEGAHKFNFGGCKIEATDEASPEHGVYVYKKGFGADCIECTSGRKILGKIRNKVFSAAKALLD